MSKIQLMGSGAFDVYCPTKRVYFRPSTDTDTIRVGDQVCYNSDSVKDHKERTVDPSHLGLTKDTYTEGEQEFTARLFIVEKPKTANLHAYAGVVKSLGDQAGGDGDMIEIWVPTENAVVLVMSDQNCINERTIMGVRNGAYEASYPGHAIGVAIETKDRSGTDGLVWMRFKNFIYDNANATMQVDDEANGVSVPGVYKINVEFIQTSGNCSALYVHAVSSAGAASSGFGLAGYFQADITATPAAHCPAVGIWLNITGGTPDVYLHALELGIYESGATLTSTPLISVLQLTHQIAQAPAANTFSWISLIEDGAETVDQFIRTKDKGDLGDVACGISGTISFDSSDRMIKVRFSSTNETYFILCVKDNS